MKVNSVPEWGYFKCFLLYLSGIELDKSSSYAFSVSKSSAESPVSVTEILPTIPLQLFSSVFDGF